jgi:hypothetical protein
MMRLQCHLNEDIIDNLTDWNIQQQFTFDSIKFIQEVFGADVASKIKQNSEHSFISVFSAGGITYYFHAVKVQNGVYSIGFYQKEGQISFERVGDKAYVGKVFAGVFWGIKKLIDTHEVSDIVFKSDEAHLSLYHTMTRWVEKRFPFKLKSIEKVGMGEYNNEISRVCYRGIKHTTSRYQ